MHKQVLYALTAGIAGYVAAVSYKVCLPSACMAVGQISLVCFVRT